MYVCFSISQGSCSMDRFPGKTPKSSSHPFWIRSRGSQVYHWSYSEWLHQHLWVWCLHSSLSTLGHPYQELECSGYTSQGLPGLSHLRWGQGNTAAILKEARKVNCRQETLIILSTFYCLVVRTIITFNSLFVIYSTKSYTSYRRWYAVGVYKSTDSSWHTHPHTTTTLWPHHFWFVSYKTGTSGPIVLAFSYTEMCVK